MRNSCFTALMLVMLVIVAAIFVLTPQERRSTAWLSNPGVLWSTR